MKKIALALLLILLSSSPQFSQTSGGSSVLSWQGEMVGQGEITLKELATPAAPTALAMGTAGTTAYQYKIISKMADGTGVASPAVVMSTGNATLSGTNYNKISWAVIRGAKQYQVFRSAAPGTSPTTTGVVATVNAPTLTYNDIGGAGDGSTAPTKSSTQAIYGSKLANGNITIAGTQSATKTTSNVALQPIGGTVSVGQYTGSYTLDVNGWINTASGYRFPDATTMTTAATVSFANPTASVGLTVVNGSASSAMRSDGAPSLSQSIAPTWTGDHIFGRSPTFGRSNIKFTSEPAPVAPTFAADSAGGAVDAGDHKYLLTYLTADGETIAGTATGSHTVSNPNNTVNLVIPVGTNPYVTGRNIYRTKAGAATYYLISAITVNDNTSTAYADTTADSSLTSTTAPTSGTTNGSIFIDGTRYFSFEKNIYSSNSSDLFMYAGTQYLKMSVPSNGAAVSFLTNEGGYTFGSFSVPDQIAISSNAYGGHVFSTNGDWSLVSARNTPTAYLKFSSVGYLGFSDSATDYTTTDVALARSSAGIAEVNNGTAGTYADLRARFFSAQDKSVLGAESLTDGAFALEPGAGKWIAAGGWDAAFTGNSANFNIAGGAGSLTQAANNLVGGVSIVPNRWYKLTYTVSAAAASPAATITSTMASPPISLTLANGPQITYFQSAASPGNFKINATAGVFSLDDIELKEVQGGSIRLGGEIRLGPTITAPGTVGAIEINKSSGRVNFAIGATSLVVTDNLCTVNSNIQAIAATNDVTGRVNAVVPANGSFTIYVTAPAAEMPVNFVLFN